MKRGAIKRLVAAAVVAAALTRADVELFSGSYHAGTTLVCSDCHTMHYSVDGGAPPSGVGGPNAKLLLQAGTNDLCLSCHNGVSGVADGAPDVMQIAGLNQALNRGAGAFRALVTATSNLSHDLGVGGQTAPGGAWATPALTGLTCAHCHDVHGNGNYRNLEPDRGGAAALSVTDVTESLFTPTATQYNVTNIKYTGDRMSQWCAGCHTNFYINPYAATFTNDANLGGGDAGDTAGGTTDQWHRHPASHVTMGEANTNLHVDSATWIAGASKTPFIDLGAAGPTTEDMPFCGSCHKAHGSDIDKDTASGFPSNLIYDDRTTATIQDGTKQSHLCQVCHNE